MEPETVLDPNDDRIFRLAGMGTAEKPAHELFLEKIYLETITADHIARALIDEILTDVQGFCDIPPGNAHCRVDVRKFDGNIEDLTGEQVKAILSSDHIGPLLNPSPKQLEAFAIFRGILDGDPNLCDSYSEVPALFPTIGAYLEGKPGCGKTHLMAGFAREAKAKLDENSDKFYGFVKRQVQRFIDEYKESQDDPTAVNAAARIDLDMDPVEEIVSKDPVKKLKKLLKDLRENIRGNNLRPSAVLYIEFDKLFEKYKDGHADTILEAIINAPLVCIDDAHPKGDPIRQTLMQHIIERRYESGYFGTFITANLSLEDASRTKEKAGVEGDGTEDQIEKRLGSRAAAMFIKLNIDDAVDWRTEVLARRVNTIYDYVRDSLVPSYESVLERVPALTVTDLNNTKTDPLGFLT